MTSQIVSGGIGPEEIRLLQEVYDRAKAVRAKHEETDAAAIAAKKLIDAFEAAIAPDRPRDKHWLLHARPKGHA